MYLLSPTSVVLYAAVWAAAILWHFVRTQEFRISHFRFSILNYYVMMSPFVLATAMSSVVASSWKPLLYFGGFAIAGVLGETIVSMWWRLYFSTRLWVYEVETIDHSYTSWLNFIPWAVGGTLYFNILTHFIADPFDPSMDFSWGVALVASMVVLLVQKLLFDLAHPRQTYRGVTISSFALFYWPVFAIITLFALFWGTKAYVLAGAFGLIATAAEYLFGKSTGFFISKKLWKYSYMAIDNGHFTPLSIPLFMLGGFYFWGAAQLLHLFIG